MDRTTGGLDIAKNVMQLHWVEAGTGEVGRKKLARARLAAYFAIGRKAQQAHAMSLWRWNFGALDEEVRHGDELDSVSAGSVDA